MQGFERHRRVRSQLGQRPRREVANLRVRILEHFNDFVDAQIKAVAAPYPEVADGFFDLPTGPGWGIELNYEFLENNTPPTEDGVIRDPGLNMFEKSEWNKRSQ